MMKILLKSLLLIFLIACDTSAGVPGTITGKVIGVKDGDTIELLLDGKSEIVRLAEIDCPEKKQPFGTRAKQFTSALCFGKVVTVQCNPRRDRYKRIVGTVFIGQQNLNEELLKAGLAWHFTQYSRSQRLARMEQAARAQKAGLWIDADAVAPWVFRKARRLHKPVLAP